MRATIFLAAAIILVITGTTNMSQAEEPKATDVYEEKTVTYTGGDYKDEVFKYRLLKPAKIEPGKKYPVVLFLHGAGERGDDNVSQLKYFPTWMAEAKNRDAYPCFVIAPQCRKDRKWVEVDWSAETHDLPKEPGDQMKVVLKILDGALKDYPIDENRQYLTGLSMGGYGSWDLAMRMPKRFAAVAPICGGGDEKHAALLKEVTIWTWHGDDDKAVPVERSRKMVAAIKAAGGKDIKYTELPGVGHDSWTAAYNGKENLLPWMFGLVRK